MSETKDNNKSKPSRKAHNAKIIIGKNDLASQCPDLLIEWDYKLNDDIITPDSITVGNSSLKVNWICVTCGHPWHATVYNRVHQHSGCPRCARQKISIAQRERLFDAQKSLVALFPEIAAEWHPEKNIPLRLQNVMPGCNDKVWWICSTCGNEFCTSVVNRTGNKHAGCPICNKYMHTSFPEQALFFYIHQVFPSAQNRYTDVFDNQMELDVFIPELNIGIEYDGGFWHSDSSVARNQNKYQVCKNTGITLIRVKENYQRHSISTTDCDICVFRENASDTGLNDVVNAVLKDLTSDVACDIDVTRDRAEIKSKYIISFKEKSLQSKFPELSLEWHPSLNGHLKPDMVMPSSADKVWWLCPKCGYEYLASPSKRTRDKPTGCPVCTNRIIIPGKNDLATVRPDIADEWHPTLNGDLLPSQIAPNYSKKVWWRCKLCGYEYPKTPNKRVAAGQGCTKCSKERVKENLHIMALKPGINDLASQYPSLLEEWDYEANADLCRPEDVTTGNTLLYINWKCAKCGNKWRANAYSRTHLGTGCKICGWKKTGQARRKIALKKGVNDLASQRPDLLKDWDYEKNEGLCAPNEITIGNCSTKVFWKCAVCGHEWRTFVYCRVHLGSGCRICSRRIRK